MSGPAYEGRCHCGAIGYTYRTAGSPDSWSIRACRCSFCRAHDALSTSEPAGTIDFWAARPKELQKYRFGLRTADFLLCRNCGVYIGALIDTDKGSFGIINVHALAPVPEQTSPSANADYGGEDTSARIRRRQERWSPATLTLSG